MICLGTLILKERLGCLQTAGEIKMELSGFCGAEKLEAVCKAGSSGNSSKRGRGCSPPLEYYTVFIVNIVVSKATVEQSFSFQLHRSEPQALRLKLGKKCIQTTEYSQQSSLSKVHGIKLQRS